MIEQNKADGRIGIVTKVHLVKMTLKKAPLGRLVLPLAENGSKGRDRVYGKVIVNSNTKPDIILSGVLGPKEIVDLIKALKRSRREEIEK